MQDVASGLESGGFVTITHIHKDTHNLSSEHKKINILHIVGL